MSVGAPDGPSNFRVFEATMTTITVPGLEQRGLAARRAWDMALANLRARAAASIPVAA